MSEGMAPVSGSGFKSTSKVSVNPPEPVSARHTFESEYREWHSENSGRRWKSPKQCSVIIQRAEKHLFPDLGSMPIDKIEPRHLMDTLLPLRGLSDETVERLVGYSNRVFGRAIALGRAKTNPAESMKYILPPREQQRQHRAALHYSEVAAALDKVDGSTAFRGTKFALTFMALTATRGAEVRGARWDEIDFDREVWEIPADRMKMRKSHTVPLSTQALAVLDGALALAGNSEYVFPSSRYETKPMSNNVMSKLFRSLGIKAVPHGFRSSFRDFASEQTDAGYEAIELSLAHSVGNQVERAYFRADLLDARRELMQAWADYLTGTGSADSGP